MAHMPEQRLLYRCWLFQLRSLQAFFYQVKRGIRYDMGKTWPGITARPFLRSLAKSLQHTCHFIEVIGYSVYDSVALCHKANLAVIVVYITHL